MRCYSSPLQVVDEVRINTGEGTERDRGHARHDTEWDDNSNVDLLDAQLEHVRFVVVLLRTCECDALGDCTNQVAQVGRERAARRHARVGLADLSGRQAQFGVEVGGGLGDGRRAHEKKGGGTRRSSPHESIGIVPVRSADDGVARGEVETLTIV